MPSSPKGKFYSSPKRKEKEKGGEKGEKGAEKGLGTNSASAPPRCFSHVPFFGRGEREAGGKEREGGVLELKDEVWLKIMSFLGIYIYLLFFFLSSPLS